MGERSKKAWRWILMILEDGNGIPSSKRIQSFLLITAAVAVAFTVKDSLIVGVLLGAALGLQGITAFQK